MSSTPPITEHTPPDLLASSSPPATPLTPPRLNPTAPSPPSTSTYLAAGAIAGVCVDVVLFPLDTIKTRMQSSAGFRASGGFTNIYAGLASAAVGSAPSAALFFATYEHTKRLLTHRMPPSDSGRRYEPLVHCTAAATAELAACLVRVPTDNIKQKRQAGLFATTQAAVRHILSTAGWRGFYVGYASTIAREIPFSLVQFPLYEHMKRAYHQHDTSQQHAPQPAAYALMGSASGSVAAALTTPMDVVKTRMMLRRGGEHAGGGGPGMLATLREVYAEGGVVRLFSGVGPRVLWIGLGGAVFLGGYEAAKVVLSGSAKSDQLVDAIR